jgi:hypothetical protein
MLHVHVGCRRDELVHVHVRDGIPLPDGVINAMLEVEVFIYQIITRDSHRTNLGE